MGKRDRSARLSAQEQEQQLITDFRAAYQDHSGQFDAICADERVKQHEAWGADLEQLYAATYVHFVGSKPNMPVLLRRGGLEDWITLEALAGRDSTLTYAIKKREQFAVHCLLAHPDTDVNELLRNQNFALRSAIESARPQSVAEDSFVEMVLSHPSVNVLLGEPNCVYQAADDGDAPLLQLLIHHPSYRPMCNHSTKWKKSPFLVACRQGHLAVVQAFATLPDFALDDETKMAALKQACKKNRLDMMKLLITLIPGGWKDFSPAERQSILLMVTQQNNFAMLDYLFQEEDFVRDPVDEKLAIQKACWVKAEGALEFLLTHSQVDLDHPELIETATWTRSILKRLLQEDRLVITPDALCYACENSMKEQVMLLLADPRGSPHRFTQNQMGQLPALLLCANRCCKVGSAPMGEMNQILEEEFLSHPDFDINQADQAGNTLLMMSLQSRDKTIFEKILSRPDIDLNMTNNSGQCAMLLAAEYLQEEQFLTLLRLPSLDLNMTHDGENCLSLAIRRSPVWLRALEFLLEQESLSSQILNMPISFPPSGNAAWSSRMAKYKHHLLWILPQSAPSLVMKLLDHPRFERYEDMPVPGELQMFWGTDRERSNEISNCLVMMLDRGAIDPSKELLEIACRRRHVELIRTLVRHGMLVPSYLDSEFVSLLSAGIPKSAASSLPPPE